MPNQSYHVIAFIIAAAVVLLATPLVRAIGLKTGYYDPPGGRKIHKRPMVRLGGVAIFLGTVLAMLGVWWTGGFNGLSADRQSDILAVALGGIGFFCIGFADDLFTLSARLRLVLQTLVASLTWLAGVHVDVLTVPFVGTMAVPDWISFPLTVIWFVGMANAINWIDGLDGLAAGVSGIAALVMLIVCLSMDRSAAGLIVAALAGSALGFLRYNFNPAQIFMGDGGAYFMGFTLAGVGVIGLVKGVTAVGVLLPYLILAVPILDMSAVIFDRLRSGNSPFIADKRHLHHRLLQAGLSHRGTVIFIYALTLWAGSLALAFSKIPHGVAIAAASTTLMIYAGWRLIQRARVGQ
jgi:UDP-GlcNAc:undecaprenyl-phosphate/decaprenyl-phosphate GlcNAc-1-phosphate transferase